MSADRGLSVAVQLDVTRLVDEIVAGVLAGLQPMLRDAKWQGYADAVQDMNLGLEPVLESGDDRHTEQFTPGEMPPRGTVGYDGPDLTGGGR